MMRGVTLEEMVASVNEKSMTNNNQDVIEDRDMECKILAKVLDMTVTRKDERVKKDYQEKARVPCVNERSCVKWEAGGH